MKQFVIIYFLLNLTLNVSSQTLTEKILSKTCNCLDSLYTIEQIEDSLENCITKSTVYFMTDSLNEDKKILSTVEGITNTIKEVKKLLPMNCIHVRKLLVEKEIEQFYKKSEKTSANEHYEKGTEYLNKAQYDKAIKEFKRAIKFDKEFVLAYDNLAISYRQQKNYKKAIKYYKKSLAICPVGNLGLMNIAVIYSLLKDYNTSLEYYNKLKYYHPDNPEGYFGAGRILFIKSDYENSLENLFTAYTMYKRIGSEYLQDSKDLISLVYVDMKKKNMLELFNKVAQRYNITIKK